MSVKTKRVRLWIELDVIPELLIPAAQRMVRDAWDDSLENIAGRELPLEVEAVYEALVASTPGPHPAWIYLDGQGFDHGGEIVREQEWPAQADTEPAPERRVSGRELSRTDDEEDVR